MQPAICLLALVPMRKEPLHRSEMVSQILFGEYVTMGEENSDFVWVRCAYDGYEGWVQKQQLTPVQEAMPATTLYTGSFATPVSRNNTLLQVPYATPVYGADAAFQIPGWQLKYLLLPQQAINTGLQQLNTPTLEALCQPFMNTPYLWGGKSVFGVDCSGFVQQVYKLLGVSLLRDASLQAEQGIAVSTLENALPGDLAFFSNESGKITHVGLMMEGNNIMHASGKVKIDTIDDGGIINSENGERTHVLASIRRMLHQSLKLG